MPDSDGGADYFVLDLVVQDWRLPVDILVEEEDQVLFGLSADQDHENGVQDEQESWEA